MLYFDPRTDCVYRNHGDGDVYSNRRESFTPTTDVECGFLVYYMYSTYDSFNSDDTRECFVLDFYSTKEDAMAQANLIADKKDGVTYACGKSARYNKGWGIDIHEVFVLHVTEVSEENKWRVN